MWQYVPIRGSNQIRTNTYCRLHTNTYITTYQSRNSRNTYPRLTKIRTPFSNTYHYWQELPLMWQVVAFSSFCTSASNPCYPKTSASHNTSASNRCSPFQDVLFSFFISWSCRPFAGARYLTNDISSAMCKTSIHTVCQEGSLLIPFLSLQISELS